ncbi:hypothetical protein GOV07_04190 [Candidatus Woesearchaeota archaeon]|nr:hypothetical protein [Candidatus Woesearchaeota archaeon]
MRLPKIPIRVVNISADEKRARNLLVSRKRIVECERHKITIKSRIDKIREECAGQPPVEERRRIAVYLGDKSYDEWIMLYDLLIKESEEEIEAFSKNSVFEQETTKRTILAAGAITACFMLILALFFLPAPVAVLTGNILGFFDQGLEDTLLSEETRGFVGFVEVRSGDGEYTAEAPPADESYDVRLNTKNDPVEIELNDVTPNQKINLRYEEVTKPIKVRNRESLTTYALDPSAIDFTDGTLTRTATGKQLWKCKDWDYDSQHCFGEWRMVRELIPGENYTIRFDRLDPGYAETDLTIIDIQSYPIVGGTWDVRFTTIGTADLEITASNGTTWSQASFNKDLQFLTLICGEEEVPYEWQDGTVYVENYTCNKTGIETSRVFTKGKHVLKFRFGDDEAYAQNYAAAQGILMLRDGTGGQSVNTAYPTGDNITWDTQERIDSAFSHGSGDANVTINTDGIYRVSYGASFTRSTANTRVEHFGRIMVNGVEATACYGQTYTRGSDGVTDAVATSDCLLNLSSGDEVVLNAGRSSSTSLATTTMVGRNWLDMQILQSPEVVLVRDVGGGQSVDNAAGNILDWDTADSVGSPFNFTATADNITINEDGIYRVTYGVAVDDASNTRYAVFGEVLVNGAVITEGHSNTYLRGLTSSRDAALTADLLLNLSAGDYIQISAGRESSTSVAVTTTANRAWFQVEKLKHSDINVIMLHKEGGGQSVDTTSGADITWDIVLRNDSDFDMVDTDTVEVQYSGFYRVVYGVYVERNNIDSRFNTFGQIRVNGVANDACWSSGYSRGLQGGIENNESLSFASCIVNLTTGDEITVRVGRESTDTGIPAVVKQNTSWFYIQSLDRINEGPTITNLTWPKNGSVQTNIPLDFNFTAADDQSSMTCTLYGNFSGSWEPNASTIGVQNDTEANITISPDDGVYSWNVICADAYGLNATYSDNFTVTVDANSPTMSSETFNVTRLNQSHKVRFNVTVADTFTVTLVNITMLYPNETSRNYSLTQATGGVWYFNFSDTNKTGIYNITTLTSRDQHNNTNVSAYTNLIFNVTPSPPVAFDLIAPANDTVTTALSPTLSWQQSADEHFANYTILVDNNSDFSSPEYVYVTSPVTNTSIDAGPFLADQTYYWRVIAYDIFGSRTNSTNTFTYITDQTDPNVQLKWPGDDDYVITSVFSFNYTPSDTNLRNCTLWGDFNGSWHANQTNMSPVNGFPNYFDISLSDGSYSWSVECYDHADNSDFASANFTVLVDTTPPQLFIEDPQNNTYENTTNNVMFFYNVTDIMANIAYCILIVDGVQSGATDFTIQEGVSQNFTAFLDNDDHLWSINCTDENGWTNSSYTYNITVNVTSESDPPVITPNYPSYNSFLDTGAFSFNYTPDDASGIENCTLYVDGAPNATNLSVTNHQPNYFPIVGLSEVTHTWQIQCYDNLTYASGSSVLWNFTVDETNPTVTLHTPENDTFYTSGNVIFNFTPTDTNVVNCTLWGNFTGSWAPRATNTSPTSGIPNTIGTSLSEGTYEWNIVCFDRAGRRGIAITNYTVKIDVNKPALTNPTVTPSSPTTYAPGKLYIFNITVTDAYLDTVYIEHDFSGVLKNYTVNRTSGDLFSYNITTIAVGSYTYQWFANDSVNRWNQTIQYGYIVQQNASEVNLLLNGTDGNFSVDENSIVNLTAVLVNPTSGYIELYLDGLRINNGSSPLTNLTLFQDPGTYNVTAVYPATENYSAYSETHYVIVNDTIKPNVTLNSPGGNATLGKPGVTFSYTVSDFSAILNCSLYINDTFNQSDNTITKDTLQYFNEDFPDGVYTWQVRCYDSWGNLGVSEIRNMTVMETTTLNVTVTPDKASYVIGEIASIDLNVTDKFGNPVTSNTSTAIIYTNQTVTMMPWWNESYPYRRPLNVTNAESATLEKGYTVTLTLDTTSSLMQSDGDDIRVVFLDESDNTLVELDRINLTAFDDASTELMFRLQRNISSLGWDGNYYIYFGNGSVTSPPTDPTEVYFFYDDFEDGDATGWQAYSSGSTIYQNIGGNGVIMKTSNDDPNGGYATFMGSLTDFEVRFRFNRPNEAGGAQSRYAISNSTFSGYGFQITDVNPSGTFGIEERLSGSSAGTLASTATSYFYLNSWYEIVQWKLNTTHNISVYNVTDGSLFSSLQGSDTTITDGFDRFVIHGGQEFYTDDIRVRMLAANEPTISDDADQHLIQYTLNQTNSQGFTSLSFDTHNHSLGNYSVVTLVSAATFDNGIGTGSFTLGPDLVAPNVTLVLPADGARSDSMLVTFTYLPVDINLQNCSLWHNASGSFSQEKGDTGVVSGENNTFTDYFDEGSYLWNVRCYDEYGNNASAIANRTFTVDRSGPVIALLSPLDEAFINSTTVNLGYNATDAAGLENCSLFIDGIFNQSDPSPTSGSDSFTVNGLSETSHTWAVVCTDNLSNVATSKNQTFTVDLTPPGAFDLLVPPTGTTDDNLTPTFSWEKTVEQNFWNYTLQVSLSASFTSSLTTEYVNFAKNATNKTVLPLSVNRIYYWRVIASDRAGWTTTSTSTFTYSTDVLPPIVLLISPPDEDNDPDGNVTLTFQADDSNITNCTLYTNLTGSWTPNVTAYDVVPGQHYGFDLNNLTTGVNLTFHWNVLCYDALNYSSFAVANWSVRIGTFNESQDNVTIPVNATVNNTLPRVESVVLPTTIDLIANGQQQVNCTANVSDDNGGGDILGANAVLYHSSVSASSPDNASNHYSNESCSCSPLNTTSVTCACGFDMWYYALPGTWTCNVRGNDAVDNGTYGSDTTTVNQLQAVDVTPTLLDYGNVDGGTPSPEKNVTVINLGNAPLNVYLWGYAVTQGDDLAMSCLNGANITISAERFSMSQGTAYGAMTSLTGSLATAPTATLNIPVRSGPSNSSLPLYWRVQSGPGVKGECNGTIVFHAQIV